MKKKYINELSIMILLIWSVSSYSQTKQEKKVQATGIDMDMYDGSQSEEANKYYDQAMEKHKNEDYNGAIKLYKKTLDEDPNFVEAYDNIAVCYRRLGDFKNAKANYMKSIELYPQGIMAHQNLGFIYGIEKKYDEAIAEYEEVQKIDPDEPEGYYGTISIYQNKGDYKSAVKAATKTLELYEATNSQFIPEAQYLLGLSYYYDGDNVKAKPYLELAKKGGIAVPDEIMKKVKSKK